MVMDMQTAQQQAGRRGEIVLNDYPLDYYDKLPENLMAVTGDTLRAVVSKYVKPDEMTIVVVAPAAAVKDQLDKLGTVEVRPMPLKRTAEAVGGELVKPTTQK
jgi:predicted Zn-dependent peptidase